MTSARLSLALVLAALVLAPPARAEQDLSLLAVQSRTRAQDPASVQPSTVQPQPATDRPTIVRIEGNRLVRNGQPFLAKGACGVNLMDRMVAAGANACRIYGPDGLAAAQQAGLAALVGLPVARPRDHFDYGDAGKVASQKDKVVALVGRLRANPAVLMWALGNELETGTTDAQRIQLWKAMDELARAIKQVDPDHPVIVVLAGCGDPKKQPKLSELREHAPALDAVGINVYAAVRAVPAAIASQGWTKPYLITEFGPIGHWEVGQHTAWHAPIEPDSTEKARTYLASYQQAVATQPRCLGSFVFLWGQKQEKTHTWYGMFLDGAPLGAVDSMTQAWTGHPPANRCPEIGPRKVRLRRAGEPFDTGDRSFAAGATIEALVDAADPDGDKLTITWDLRRDVSDAPQQGGDYEPPSPPIEGAVRSTGATTARVQLPARPGHWRLFCYVKDTQNHAATINVPLESR